MPETQVVEDKELKTEPDDNNEEAGKEEKEPEKVKIEENLKAEETEDVKVEKKSENDIL